MKATLILLALLLQPMVGLSQDRVFDCVESAWHSSAKGQDILQKVQSAYAGISTLKAKFIQNSYLAALEISELSSGQVWFKRPGQMRWHYTEPEEQIFVVRDSTLWLYQVKEKQVTVDDFAQVLISDLPVSFLLGMGDLKKDFRLIRSCQNSSGIVLELLPLSAGPKAESELKTFKLLVNSDNYRPQGAFVTDVGDNTTSIILSDLELNQEVPNSTFETSFGSGLDLIDRREERKKP
jgi:outer membrane lipoprotein carrier protein